MFKNAAEVFDYIKKNDVKLVDVRFIDLPGIQHHFNVPVESFDEAVFTDGKSGRIERRLYEDYKVHYTVLEVIKD